MHPGGALTVQNAASQQSSLPPAETTRRSGNYHPSIWSHSRITESMRSAYSETRFLVRLEELKAEARLLLRRRCRTPALDLLRTIDSMERLGVAYHFQGEIELALDRYHQIHHENCSSYSSGAGSNCEEVALGFRLLRQHGHRVSSERVLRAFKDLNVGVDPKNMIISSQDINIRCLLELYEASHLATSCGEESSTVGEMIKATVSAHLKSVVEAGDQLLQLAQQQQVRHSLEMPLQWTMPRLEARRYIDVYASNKEDGDPVLLELAKLDFNIVQALHQRELQELSRWWTGLGLIESLPFSRDRLVENYLGAVGIAFEPQYSNVRVWLTKLICVLNVIDDVYDVYGSLGELELFTNAVESWKREAAEMLPEYMKPCFLALHDLVNETVREISRIHGWDATPFVCKEAEMERGDISKTLECFMEDSGESEDIAREHIKGLVGELWRELNAECHRINSTGELPRDFVSMVVNMSRAAECIFQYGDGIGTSTGITKDRIISLFVEGIE